MLNEAHARDPEFYQTLRTLDSYKAIINEKTTLVLSASSSLLKLLVDGVPNARAAASASSPTIEQDGDVGASAADELPASDNVVSDGEAETQMSGEKSGNEGGTNE